MTEVAFHFNLPDPTHYLCRLLRKVVGVGKKALVLLPPTRVAELDQLLWTFSQEDFLPHARSSDVASVCQRSPVLLATGMCDPGHSQVLINTLAGVPEGFERFERVIELVGPSDEERLAARQRWRAYAQQGYGLVRHDLAHAKGTQA